MDVLLSRDIDKESQKKREWTWENMKKYRQICCRYVDLYIKTKKKTSTDVETNEFQTMEKEMSFESQIHCRKIGLSFLRKDRLYQEEMQW